MLRGMPLKELEFDDSSQVTDLSPIDGMQFDVLSVAGHNIEDYSPLRTVHARVLWIKSGTLTDLDVVEHMTDVEELHLQGSKLANIAALRAMKKLTQLYIYGTAITDLSPLEGLPIRTLQIESCPLTDLSPVANLKKLERFIVGECPVTDVTPLASSKMTQLNLSCKELTDLRPLAQMPNLQRLQIPKHCRDIEFLRGKESLQYLDTTHSHKSVEDFWREFDAATPDDE